MIRFNKNNITIVRGDTAELEITFSEQVDSAVLSVKKKISDTDYVFQSQVVDGVLKITHADTNNLVPGQYVYDIQVKYGDVVDTPLIGEFNVVADVTRE